MDVVRRAAVTEVGPVLNLTRITLQFEERFRLLPVGGSLVPVVDRVFPIGAAEAAHADVREYRNIGKVILEVQGVG